VEPVIAGIGEYVHKNIFITESDFTILRIVKKTTFLDIMIDTEDASLVAEWQWHCADKVYSYVQGNCELYRQLHRFILKYDGPLVVDHKNRNRKDNRKQNLRIVSPSDNSYNRPYVRFNASKNDWDIDSLAHRIHLGR
jgi:hypothetical protein